MTGHYAKVHDATIREAFDRYQSQRVNISGEPISDNPGAVYHLRVDGRSAACQGVRSRA
jgi:hypothetical protein